MGPPGVEPGTPWSSVMCSPAELRSQFKLMFSTFKCLENSYQVKSNAGSILIILDNSWTIFWVLRDNFLP